MVTNWCLGAGEKREDESLMTPGFRGAMIGRGNSPGQGQGVEGGS